MASNKVLSIFADESGNLSLGDDSSRFYIVCLVIHDQSASILDLASRFDADMERLGLCNLCFHAGPIIRREDGYAYMGWQLRNRIFSAMMAFSRKADFRYRCLCVDKKFVTSSEHLLALLRTDLDTFLSAVAAEAPSRVKVYYDCGQAPVTNLLRDAIFARFADTAEFAQDVRPENYKLFQVADLVCSLSLIERKLSAGTPMTKSENKFFGGPKAFKHNILRHIKRKEFA